MVKIISQNVVEVRMEPQELMNLLGLKGSVECLYVAEGQFVLLVHDLARSEKTVELSL